MLQLQNCLRPFTTEALKAELAKLAEPNSLFTLHVSDGPSERVVYFTSETVFLHSSGKRCGPSIPERLFQLGKLDRDGLHEVLEETQGGKLNLQEALLQKSVFLPEEFEELSRKLIRDEIFDLVFWEDALFKSTPAPPPTDFFRADRAILSAKMSLPQLLEEALGWIQVWLAHKHVLPSDTCHLALTGEGRKAATGEAVPEEAILKALMDGPKLRTLWRRLEIDLPSLFPMLAGLAEKGWISIALETQANEGAMLHQSIALLEEVLPQALGKEMVSIKLANLYRKAKIPDKACACLQKIADEAESRGNWETACECLRSLLGIRPESTPALRQAVKLCLEHSAAKSAVHIAFQTAQSLHREGKMPELEAASGILGAISEAGILAREVKADLISLKGEKDKASREYAVIACQYEEEDDIERARLVAGKALACSPENEILKKRYLRLKRLAVESQKGPGIEAIIRKLRRRVARMLSLRKPAGMAAAAIAVLLLGGGIFWRSCWIPWEEKKAEAAGSKEKKPQGEASGKKAKPPVQFVVPASKGRAAAGSPGPAAQGGLPAAGSSGASPAGGPAAAIPERGRSGLDPRETFILDEKGGEPTAGESSPQHPGDPAEEGTEAPEASIDAGAAEPREESKGSDGPPDPIPDPKALAPESLPAVDRGAAILREKGAFPAKPETSSPAASAIRTPIRGIPDDAEILALLPTQEKVTKNLCFRHETHRITARPLGPERKVLFAQACDLTVEDTKSGQVIFMIEGGDGIHWAIAPRGEMICAWKPGERAAIYPDFSYDQKVVTSWTFPPGTEAVAIGRDQIVLRQGRETRLFGIDGILIRSGELPAWEEGAIAGKTLFIALPREGEKPREVWAVDVKTLRLVRSLKPPPAK